MSWFSFADWVVILVYLVGIVAIGLWLGRDQRTTRDYFLGSRTIPWWGIGMSIVAAETSALTIIGVPTMAYGGNLAFLQMIIGYVIARIILAVVLVPHYFRGEIYSPYQLFGNAFGPSARQAAAGFFLVMETLAAGVRVYVACIPIQLMLGLTIFQSILIFVGLSLLYTTFGGVKAVIWTDAAQFGLFLLGGLFTLVYIPTLIPGGWSATSQEAAAGGKLQWLNWEFSWGAPFNIWMGVIGGTVQVLSSHGAEQLIVQRVLACRTVAEGRKALVLSAVIIFPLFLIFLLCGAWLWVYYRHFDMAIPLPEARPGIKAYDFIYPIFITTAVPHVLKGFLIVAILSAAMSSVSSALTALASVSTMDIMKTLRKVRGTESEAESSAYYLRFSRYSTVAWALVLVGVAYASRETTYVLSTAFQLRGLTSGALLGGLILAISRVRLSARAVIASMSLSFAGMALIAWKTALFWPWYTLIGTLITLGSATIFKKVVRQKA